MTIDRPITRRFSEVAIPTSSCGGHTLDPATTNQPTDSDAPQKKQKQNATCRFHFPSTNQRLESASRRFYFEFARGRSRSSQELFLY